MTVRVAAGDLVVFGTYVGAAAGGAVLVLMLVLSVSTSVLLVLQLNFFIDLEELILHFSRT